MTREHAANSVHTEEELWSRSEDTAGNKSSFMDHLFGKSAVMLTVLLIMSMFSQGLSVNSCGTRFITAFPETLAYYYQKNQNFLSITSLHPQTGVQIQFMGGVDNSTSMIFSNAGDTKTWNPTKEVEEHLFTSSNKSVLISSTKDITVLAVSWYSGKVLSRVVEPVQNLGTVYHVPPLNYSEILTSFNLSMFSEPRFSSFRVMVINAINGTNTVTIKRVDETGQNSQYTQTLDPYHVFQLQNNATVTEVNGTGKIAVMLTHPCFEAGNCSCNTVMNVLRPARRSNKPDRFPLPSNFSADLTQLFLTTNQSVKVANGTVEPDNGVEVRRSSNILPMLPGLNGAAQVMSASLQVPVLLIRPGLVLDLIPESMFSGCYLVHFLTARSGALVIAETTGTGSVKMDNGPLPPAATWSVVNGSRFSWTFVTGQRRSIIWHPDSKIAVYMIETLESRGFYANPAIVVNEEPDPNGCMATPGIFLVGNDTLSWPMARRFCMDNSDHFARILRKQNQDRMAVNISLPEPTEGWISLRRDLFTREWYWKNEDSASPSVTVAYWADGEPDLPERGLCASVSMDPAKNFTWSSARCCSKKKPVCYKKPIYLYNVS